MIDKGYITINTCYEFTIASESEVKDNSGELLGYSDDSPLVFSGIRTNTDKSKNIKSGEGPSQHGVKDKDFYTTNLTSDDEHTRKANLDTFVQSFFGTISHAGDYDNGNLISRLQTSNEINNGITSNYNILSNISSILNYTETNEITNRWKKDKDLLTDLYINVDRLPELDTDPSAINLDIDFSTYEYYNKFYKESTKVKIIDKIYFSFRIYPNLANLVSIKELLDQIVRLGSLHIFNISNRVMTFKCIKSNIDMTNLNIYFNYNKNNNIILNYNNKNKEYINLTKTYNDALIVFKEEKDKRPEIQKLSSDEDFITEVKQELSEDDWNELNKYKKNLSLIDLCDRIVKIYNNNKQVNSDSNITIKQIVRQLIDKLKSISNNKTENKTEALISQNLDDFKTINDRLNPLLWDENNNLKPIIRNCLINIYDFVCKEVEDLLNEVSLAISDIILIGSQCNYNYTKNSDLDLHFIISRIDNRLKQSDQASVSEFENIVIELLWKIRSDLNNNYDIKIKGIPVEISFEFSFLNKSSFERKTMGEYSLAMDNWISRPIKLNISDREHFDDLAKTAEDNAENYLDFINILLDNNNTTETEIDSVLDDIYTNRQIGLAEDGELGQKNLEFKMIRSANALDNLKEKRRKIISKKLSLEHNINRG